MNQDMQYLHITPLLIGGIETSATPSLQFPVYSNGQQKNVGFAESADRATAIQACEAVADGFKTWKHVPAVARRELLLRYANLLRERAPELIAVQMEETSADESWGRKNIQLATALIEETASCVTSLKGEILQAERSDTLALAFTVPVGAVLVIAPWNSPIILGARNIATAVAAGCSVVFKVSELCPRLHHLLARILIDAGLPSNVISVIQASRDKASEVTEAIIAHPAIRKVEFVGSARVGRIVGQLCSKYLKPIFMELGGKGAAIVLDDADLEQAAKKCTLGAFLNHGQLCFSTERIIVLESVAAGFKAMLKKHVEEFKVTAGVAPHIVEASVEKLKDAQCKGAVFLAGSAQYAGTTTLTPSIIFGVTKDMDLHDEESFGPSAALFVARDDAHAIEIANNTQYGLNAAIHTKDFHRGLAMAKELETGQVHINNMTPHDEPTLPLGGVKSSGWGRNNAIYGLREFCEVKTVTWSLEGCEFV